MNIPGEFALSETASADAENTISRVFPLKVPSRRVSIEAQGFQASGTTATGPTRRWRLWQVFLDSCAARRRPPAVLWSARADD